MIQLIMNDPLTTLNSERSVREKEMTELTFCEHFQPALPSRCSPTNAVWALWPPTHSPPPTPYQSAPKIQTQQRHQQLHQQTTKKDKIAQKPNKDNNELLEWQED
jgi:hypothetical protein